MPTELPEHVRQQLLARARRDGPEAVAAELGTTPATLCRALAGLGSHRGTIALLMHGAKNHDVASAA
ncbi:MAG: hypothetical protein R3B72_01320 [Polyangiaceae bacterium]